MSDLISREAAIERATRDHDFYKGATTPADMARRDELLNVMCWLGELPSAQPYTDEEIQKMQDIEQAQLDKAYEMGKADALRWIPCSERLPEEDYCTGRGIQHSAEVLVTIVHHANDDDTFVDTAMTVDGVWQLTYPPDDDPDIPKWCEVIAWMPLPEPYKKGEEHE